jgi:hypothetical protein
VSLLSKDGSDLNFKERELIITTPACKMLKAYKFGSMCELKIKHASLGNVFEAKRTTLGTHWVFEHPSDKTVREIKNFT